MKILIVEDDSMVRGAEKALCEMNEWEAVEAVDGKEALNVLSGGHDIDLVILDWHIPRVSGQEVYDWIRNKLPDLPVLVITGDYIANVENILYKPISIDTLLEKISSMVDKRL